jgi:branched-chain amino acid aminotransferase
MNSFPITQNDHPKHRPADNDLRFGQVFTDHMFKMDYTKAKGWHDARIVPYAPFTMDPASCVLHYAQAVFDGLKAFRGDDKQIRLFRPDRHAARLNRSCERLCIPALDPALVQDSFKALVAVDADWVPSLKGTAMYLRPTVIATDIFLGVHPSETYLYYVILSPVGAYYKEGLSPVKIMATDQYVRAMQGGIGAAKTAANYAASLYAGREAERQGYAQVLWLDGRDHEFLDEVGSMNVMLKINDVVITPPLTSGTILDGVTRQSVLQLLRDWNVKIEERPISINEVVAAHSAGTLQEMWGTGTAVVIAPVGELGFRGSRMAINAGETGDLTRRLYDAITAIQHGTTNDLHGWTEIVKPQAR